VPALEQQAPPQARFFWGNLVSGHRLRYTLPHPVNQPGS
jgi:hypothetical protein